MARVVLPRSLGEHTGGVLELDVAGDTVRALIEGIDARFPGVGELLAGRMAVAIDGEIVGDPFLERVPPGGEVHFLPPIGGG